MTVSQSGFRIIQPVMWAGMQKGGPDSPMVCGACPDWQACAASDRCARATDEDYARSPLARKDEHTPRGQCVICGKWIDANIVHRHDGPITDSDKVPRGE
jgi:hypothetical protein